MSTEDAAALLADIVASLDNLPSEVLHILQEIHAKDSLAAAHTNRALSKESSIQKFAKASLLVNNPKEETNIVKIQHEFEQAEELSKQKIKLAERAIKLLSRHLERVSTQLQLLTPDAPPLPELPSFNSSASLINGQVIPNGIGVNMTNGIHGANSSAYQVFANLANPAAPAQTSTAALLRQRLLQSNPQLANLPPDQLQRLLIRQTQLSNQRQMLPNAQQLTPHQIQQQQILLRLQQQQAQVQAQAQAQVQQQQMQSQPQPQPIRHSTRERKRRAVQIDDEEDEEPEMELDETEDEAEGEMEAEAEAEAGEDDNTPYCLCQRPSFGEMIGCDATDCAIEWFHLSCVGLKNTPDGSWFCNDCEEKKKEREKKRKR